MEENVNNQEVEQQQQPQPVQEQPGEEKPQGLLPGQEHEDELNYMGEALFAIARNGFNWIKHFFVAK